jgi:hypothetical protein
MTTSAICASTPINPSQPLAVDCKPDPGFLGVFVSVKGSLSSRWGAGRPAARILIRPQPGFYVMRLRWGAPVVPAVIYQLCPMVVPQPTNVAGPHPDEWCRPLDRSARYEARLDDKRVHIDRVWTARSLRQVTAGSLSSAAAPCGAGPDKIPARPKQCRGARSISMRFPRYFRR